MSANQLCAIYLPEGLEITGQPWSDVQRREVHKACWIIEEVGSPKYGIPDELNVATIVTHNGSFQADVNVVVDTPSLGKLFGFPWPADDPVLFVANRPDSAIGPLPRDSRFETLSVADWNLLISGCENMNPVEHTLSEPNAKAGTKDPSHKTYRAQWELAQQGRLTAKEFLASVLTLHEKNCDISIHSLSSSPDSPATNMATLTSSLLGTILGPRERWHKEVQNSYQGKQYVVFDTTFLSFTSLGGTVGDYDVE
ncbi:MAG: hypothetical protein Q9163_004242 [Psora crenata]